MDKLPQNPENQEFLLEQLLSGAAERAAAQQMNELAQKGTVTKAEFGTALSEFENRLIGRIEGMVAQKAAEPAQADPAPEPDPDPVQKAAGRRSTVPSDPRSDNPVRYLIQKARSKEELDPTDKETIWGLTMKGLTQGMSTAEIEGGDFADEYAN